MRISYPPAFEIKQKSEFSQKIRMSLLLYQQHYKLIIQQKRQAINEKTQIHTNTQNYHTSNNSQYGHLSSMAANKWNKGGLF